MEYELINFISFHFISNKISFHFISFHGNVCMVYFSIIPCAKQVPLFKNRHTLSYYYSVIELQKHVKLHNDAIILLR